MITIGSFEAKTHLPDLLRKVEAGEEIAITRHGKVVAHLIPASFRNKDRIESAISEVKRVREVMPKFSHDELREMRHEGHRY